MQPERGRAGASDETGRGQDGPSLAVEAERLSADPADRIEARLVRRELDAISPEGESEDCVPPA